MLVCTYMSGTVHDQYHSHNNADFFQRQKYCFSLVVLYMMRCNKERSVKAPKMREALAPLDAIPYLY